MAEAETGNTTDSSSSSDEEMFPTSLEVTDLIILAQHLIILCQDVNSGDRTFNSILSLLVGRQSVSQTLRLLRQEVRIPGEEETESSSGNDVTKRRLSSLFLFSYILKIPQGIAHT